MNAETLRAYGTHLTRTQWLTLASLATALVFAILSVRSALPAIEWEFKFPGSDINYFRGAGYLAREGDAEYLYVRPIPPEVLDGLRDQRSQIPGGFAYTPLTAYASLPLADQTPVDAGKTWQRAVLAAILVTGVAVASAFKSWHWRLAIVLAAFAWYPLLLNIRFAQTGAFGAAIVAVGYALFFKQRVGGAGLLGLLIFKPTFAIGPGLAMLGERRRVILTWGLAVLAIGIVPIFLVGGVDAFQGWIDVLRERVTTELGGRHKLQEGLMRHVDFVGVAGYAMLAVIGAILVASVVLVHERLGVAEAAVLSIAATMLLSPHSLIYDWGFLYVTILLVRRSQSLPLLANDFGAGIFAIVLFGFGQWSQHILDVKGEMFLHPLSLWAVGVSAALVGIALSRGGVPAMPFSNSTIQNFRS
jgi:hypothetical protein